jgi:hypothetical protein
MRWLAWSVIVGSAACTRTNPSFGDGGGTGREDDDDPSSASADDSVSVGDDAEASAEDNSSFETGASDTTKGDTSGSRPCCAAHSHGGCEVPAIEDCVCTGEPECCVEWSELCVDKARMFCAAECSIDEEEGPLDTSDTLDSAGSSGTTSSDTSTTTASDEDGSTTLNLSDCCVPHDGPGCPDASIETCVCVTQALSACCEQDWTETCVAAVPECSALCGG